MPTWGNACIATAIVAALLDAAPAAAAARATEWSQSTRPPRTRVEIRPGPLSHRECVDGLQVSGTSRVINLKRR